MQGKDSELIHTLNSALEMGRTSTAHKAIEENRKRTWRQAQLPELRGPKEALGAVQQGAGVAQAVNSRVPVAPSYEGWWQVSRPVSYRPYSGPHSAQDPGSTQHPQGLCLSTSPSADFQEEPRSSSQGREGETRPGSATHSPGDLDEVTALLGPTSYCASGGCPRQTGRALSEHPGAGRLYDPASHL